MFCTFPPEVCPADPADCGDCLHLQPEAYGPTAYKLAGPDLDEIVAMCTYRQPPEATQETPDVDTRKSVSRYRVASSRWMIF